MNQSNKKITVKDYIQKVSDSQYLPATLVYDLDSQKNLEQIRNMPQKEKGGNLRLFANNVTKHWHYPQPPNDLQILKYVDERYFSRVILYFMFNFVVESLILNRRRKTLDLNLRSFLTQILNTYFSNKKIKRKQYESLTQSEVSFMFDKFIANFWSNLLELDLIHRADRGVISLKKETTFMLFDELVTMKFRNYPCVYKPKDWDISGKNGGYYITPTELITKKPTFMGKLKWSSRLIDIINSLQNDSWSIDFPLEYIKTDFSFNEDVVLFKRKGKKTQEEKDVEKEDIIQHLHTRFFLENFTSKVSRFFYPYTMDFRGRIYPMCSWGYSPTSSKKIRQCIRTSKEFVLTEKGAFWLKVLLAHILKLEQETTRTTVQTINDKWDNIPNIINEMPFNYTKHLASTVYNDLKRGSSSVLIQLDATSSVYQIISLIINDKNLMSHTNLIDESNEKKEQNPDFVYKDIYAYIESRCRAELPNDVYTIFLDRSVFKSVLMPLIYGKTLNSNVKDLVQYIKDIGAVYNTGNLVKTPELYNQYKALQAYPIKTLLADLPENLRENFKEIIKTRPNEVTLFYWKKRYMAHVFFKIITDVLYREFPNLKDFTALFTGKVPVLKHSTYTTPYFLFENKHRKVKKNRIEVAIKNTVRKYSFPQILDQVEKRTSGEAANCVHSLDAFILHYILDHRGCIPLIPIHDCLMVHPNNADDLFKLINEAYKALQTLVSENPVFSHFHKDGSIDITSYNIFKFEYKEVKSYQDDVVPNDLDGEDDDFDDD